MRYLRKKSRQLLKPTTFSVNNIEKAMVQIKEAAEKNPIIQGIHLEGPFISVNYKGAQDASNIKKPDEKALAHWNELSGNRIRVVTYAPEEATEEFENWCLSNRIVPSAGHSDATYDQLVASRACHVTHLYNAQRGLKHREPGVTGYGFLRLFYSRREWRKDMSISFVSSAVFLMWKLWLRLRMTRS